MLFSLLLQQSPSNSIALFAPYVLIGVVFYFLLFMPMQRQKKRQQQMLNELKSGDSVVTSGGIVGTITAVDGNAEILQFAEESSRDWPEINFAQHDLRSLPYAKDSFDLVLTGQGAY